MVLDWVRDGADSAYRGTRRPNRDANAIHRHETGGDVFASHDIEDIVTVVDGRPEIVEEVAGADAPVRSFISSEIRTLLDNPDFVDALPGLLPPDASSQARQRILGERLRALSESCP